MGGFRAEGVGDGGPLRTRQCSGTVAPFPRRRAGTIVPCRTRRPGSRWHGGNSMLEESPGSNETGRRLTAARRKPRESATESKPPRGVRQEERVKGWGKSPPQAWQQGWQGKPRPEQDQVGGTYGPSYARAPGVSREAPSNGRPRGMAARPRKGRTEPGLQAFWSFFSPAPIMWQTCMPSVHYI
jgi:hypothetical protein